MAPTSLAHLRREYRNKPLLESQAPADPLRLFEKWFREALKVKALDVNAMILATVSPAGQPSARVVLLKGYDRKGFVFFTNYLSHKGRDLERHPQASLLFFWPELSRQIRLDGTARPVATWESDEYFQTRPRDSQLGAWVSEQSRVIGDRKVLDRRMREFEAKFRGKLVPRPPHWGGYRLNPKTIEFWKGQPSRLHDRLVYRKRSGNGWARERLAP
ncbi:MAG TPA: pyridoxamine 5'-phosphate oxidase [bacterium]|nr:pyridoxamine 5'-phosphate oxidase [bacterium]